MILSDHLLKKKNVKTISKIYLKGNIQIHKIYITFVLRFNVTRLILFDFGEIPFLQINLK